MFKFLYEQRDIYRSKIDAETMNDLEEMYDRLIDGEKQLHSEHYSRMILYLNLPVESEETYDYLTVIKGAVGKYYDESYFVGETAKDKDFSDAFSTDNTLISILTVVFVILVLLVTFKSVALPLLLILVIQGSVWINFSFPALLHNNLYFLAYLIVSAIMMGANIDYAIVISSRYLRLKEEMPYKEAMIEALNQAFPLLHLHISDIDRSADRAVHAAVDLRIDVTVDIAAHVSIDTHGPLQMLRRGVVANRKGCFFNQRIAQQQDLRQDAHDQHHRDQRAAAQADADGRDRVLRGQKDRWTCRLRRGSCRRSRPWGSAGCAPRSWLPYRASPL